jgi:hypothetical protein
MKKLRLIEDVRFEDVDSLKKLKPTSDI